MNGRTFCRFIALVAIMVVGSLSVFVTEAEARDRRHGTRSPETIRGIVIGMTTDELVVRNGDGDIALIITSETRMRGTLEVSVQVEVKVITNADGNSVAVSVEAERDVLEITGVLRELSDSGFVLQNARGDIRVETDERTIVIVGGIVASLADLAIGDYVEIHALRTSETSLLALLVVAEAENIELHGMITGLADASLTLRSARGEIEIGLTPDTVVRIYGRDGTLADLRVGMHVEVDTQRSTDGSLVAVVIKVENAFDMLEINGIVASVSEREMTIQTRHGEEIIVAIMPDTIVLRGDEIISVSDIRVGDRVEVKTTRTVGGTLVAVRIRIEDAEDDLREIEGVIASFEGSLLTLTLRGGSTVTVIVDSETVIRVEREMGTVADLLPGRRVEVHVRHNADDSLTAVAIKVETEGHDDGEFEIEGMVTALTDSSITLATFRVGEMVFAVNEATVVTRGEVVISFSEIEIGQHVEIHAESDGSGGLTAIQIKVEPKDDGGMEVEVKGKVTAVSSSSITLGTDRGEMTFAVTSTTEVFIDKEPASIGDVLVGDEAEIKGRMGQGRLVAERIRVEREHD